MSLSDDVSRSESDTSVDDPARLWEDIKNETGLGSYEKDSNGYEDNVDWHFYHEAANCLMFDFSESGFSKCDYCISPATVEDRFHSWRCYSSP